MSKLASSKILSKSLCLLAVGAFFSINGYSAELDFKSLYGCVKASRARESNLWNRMFEKPFLTWENYSAEKVTITIFNEVGANTADFPRSERTQATLRPPGESNFIYMVLDPKRGSLRIRPTPSVDPQFKNVVNVSYERLGVGEATRRALERLNFRVEELDELAKDDWAELKFQTQLASTAGDWESSPETRRVDLKELMRPLEESNKLLKACSQLELLGFDNVLESIFLRQQEMIAYYKKLLN